MRILTASSCLSLVRSRLRPRWRRARDAFVATTDPLGEPVKKVVYLEQNWSPAQSVQFYFTEQGSQIIPYDWFLALEQARSSDTIPR